MDENNDINHDFRSENQPDYEIPPQSESVETSDQLSHRPDSSQIPETHPSQETTAVTALRETNLAPEAVGPESSSFFPSEQALRSHHQIIIPKLITNAVILAVLFGLGMAISIAYHRIKSRSAQSPAAVVAPQSVQKQETPTPKAATPVSRGLYEVKTTVAGRGSGIFIRLPPEMLVPICDSQACTSYGSYLSGGTRFTVSIRSDQALISNFSDANITDANSTPFVNRNMTLNGKNAREFTGDFEGTTSGGFRFTKMHGVLIQLDQRGVLELNHFAPAGINVDFDRDDEVFSQIISTVTFPDTLSATPDKCLQYVSSPCDIRSCDYNQKLCQMTPFPTRSPNETK
ncbi:hypothetical protein A2154_00690 [Candidatus Gottesmanbacteria bacterium RBG_16_43_7]|uniref:Uncharacterized protein n=1 Tax=Candidatus Gottesmanbacteria bacterium RBG_16_43_7 TaxID=1798373 RepID=A0A1F5Z848_9BACT|nr:MAG: hypothetical protein A2154_00690 [Candidatus Gottesmanbacteria bacterium RBG_16_43_7]